MTPAAYEQDFETVCSRSCLQTAGASGLIFGAVSFPDLIGRFLLDFYRSTSAAAIRASFRSTTSRRRHSGCGSYRSDVHLQIAARVLLRGHRTFLVLVLVKAVRLIDFRQAYDSHQHGPGDGPRSISRPISPGGSPDPQEPDPKSCPFRSQRDLQVGN